MRVRNIVLTAAILLTATIHAPHAFAGGGGGEAGGGDDRRPLIFDPNTVPQKNPQKEHKQILDGSTRDIYTGETTRLQVFNSGLRILTVTGEDGTVIDKKVVVKAKTQKPVKLSEKTLQDGRTLTFYRDANGTYARLAVDGRTVPVDGSIGFGGEMVPFR